VRPGACDTRAVLARAQTLRLLSLLLVGELVVHRLRYAVGYHGGAEGALAGQGHAYLSAAGGFVLLLAALVAAHLARSLPGRPVGGLTVPVPLARMWAASSAALAGLFVVQELAEGALSLAHPDGVAGVLGHGGWTGLGFAVVVGSMIALAERGARAALIVEPSPSPRRYPVRIAVPPATRRSQVERASGFVASRLGARGPPLLGT